MGIKIVPKRDYGYDVDHPSWKRAKKKAASTKMNRQGLSPAEEARSGTASQKARKKAMKVKGYRHGGMVKGITSDMYSANPSYYVMSGKLKV